MKRFFAVLLTGCLAVSIGAAPIKKNTKLKNTKLKKLDLRDIGTLVNLKPFTSLENVKLPQLTYPHTSVQRRIFLQTQIEQLPEKVRRVYCPTYIGGNIDGCLQAIIKRINQLDYLSVDRQLFSSLYQKYKDQPLLLRKIHDCDNRPALHEAVFSGDGWILSGDGIILDRRDNNQIVESLIKVGCKSDIENALAFLISELHPCPYRIIVLTANSVGLYMKKVIDHGFDINELVHGRSFISYAVRAKSLDMVKILLENGATPNKLEGERRFNDGCGPLSICAYLMKYPLDRRCRDRGWGKRTINNIKCVYEIAKKLLESGADLSLLNASERAVIKSVISYQDSQEALKKRFEINSNNSTSSTSQKNNID